MTVSIDQTIRSGRIDVETNFSRLRAKSTRPVLETVLLTARSGESVPASELDASAKKIQCPSSA